MADFVLVPGAWHGAWVWQRVVPLLTGAGHRVHTVTLTGTGDRAHLLRADTDLETHIADIAAVIESEELHGAVLAVHSYAGMLGTAVADRMPDRLAHLVYVDAVVPKPGESWSSTHASATREQRIADAAQHPLSAMPAPDPKGFGLSGGDHAWVQQRLTPHPGRTYTQPLDFDPQRVARVPRTFVDCHQPALATIDPIRQRVRDPQFWGAAWAPGAQVVRLATGHDPMVTLPGELAAVLRGAAGA